MANTNRLRLLTLTSRTRLLMGKRFIARPAAFNAMAAQAHAYHCVMGKLNNCARVCVCALIFLRSCTLSCFFCALTFLAKLGKSAKLPRFHFTACPRHPPPCRSLISLLFCNVLACVCVCSFLCAIYEL